MNSKKMNIELMRKFNTQTVLKIVHNKGPIARSDIAEIMNLSRPSVSEIVTQLIEEGWMRETDSEPSGRGRRPIPLELDPDRRFAIGVAIEAFQVFIIITNFKAEIIAQEKFKIDRSIKPENVLNKACDVIEQLIHMLHLLRSQLLGIGVAMHGIVDYKQGVSIFAPNLGWHNVPIRDFFENRTDLLTIVDSDCNSSALAELWFGQAKGKSHFITVLDDYGLGAGIIIDGKTYRGSNYIEGQIGHTMVDETGPQCACGNYGCLEVMASESAIVYQAKRQLKLGEQSQLRDMVQDLDSLTVDDVYKAAYERDPLALEIISHAGRYLGIGFATLVTLFGPDFVVLGGGIVRVANIIIPVIEKMIEQRAFGDVAKKTPVIASTFGSQLYPIGAATLVIENAFSHPETAPSLKEISDL